MSKKSTDKKQNPEAGKDGCNTVMIEPKLIINPPVHSSEITKLRIKTGLTQGETAEMLGLSGRQLVSAYERGVKNPTRQTWTLWLLLADEHPDIKVVPRK